MIENESLDHKNNLYTIKTDLSIVGLTKIIFDKESTISDDENYNSKEYVLMASCRLRKDIIQKNLLNQDEVYAILSNTSKKMFSMKIPDMSYLVLNTFEMLKKQYFFQPQLIMGGMNICDICLCDPGTVQQGLINFQQNH